MRRLLPWLGAAALVAVLVIGLTQAGDGASDPAPQAPGLDAQLARVDAAPAPLARLYDKPNQLVPGGRTRFAAQLRALRGYPVVVNAWASWCGPCKLEFPFFQRASTRLGTRIAFFGLNVSDNADDAKRFLRREPVIYPSMVDANARIVQAEGASAGLPVTLFYDKRGKQTFVHQGGYRSEADLVADIRRYTK